MTLRTSPHARMAAAWIVALCCGAGVEWLSGLAYSALPRPRPLEELSYYPSGRALRPLTLGHAEAAADFAWLRAVQYYGEHRKSDNEFTRMFHVFDILTTMAPHFESAYVFGAFALAQEGQDFVSGERLMLKGIEANPSSGQLAFKLGFLYFVRPGKRDLPRAAEYFEQAARFPDGPPQAARFAAFSRQHSGSLAVAYELWRNVYETTRNKAMREMAQLEMEKIERAIRSGRTDLAMRRLAVPRVSILGGP